MTKNAQKITFSGKNGALAAIRPAFNLVMNPKTDSDPDSGPDSGIKSGINPHMTSDLLSRLVCGLWHRHRAPTKIKSDQVFN